MVAKLKRQFITPTLMPIAVAIVVTVMIITIGEMLLALYQSGRPELQRVELWVGTLLSLAILGVAAFLATRPAGRLGPLDREVAIGKQEFFAPELPPVDVAARNGPLGTVDDITAGYMLYARNGALARVVGIIPGSEEFGRRFRGFIYAQGVHGASDELWIPYEAVMAVYP
ncbi:MAG: hypothetical protein M3Q03_17660, partial [Chloroflexota bacterium]|nr:hypothetical protein [Chloroflexota bacterium]